MTMKQFGLVTNNQLVLEGGRPVITGPLSMPPSEFSARFPAGSKWLPVIDRGARPFDPEANYRLKPNYVVEGSSVVRLYPIEGIDAQ